MSVKVLCEFLQPFYSARNKISHARTHTRTSLRNHIYARVLLFYSLAEKITQTLPGYPSDIAALEDMTYSFLPHDNHSEISCQFVQVLRQLIHVTVKLSCQENEGF